MAKRPDDLEKKNVVSFGPPEEFIESLLDQQAQVPEDDPGTESQFAEPLPVPIPAEAPPPVIRPPDMGDVVISDEFNKPVQDFRSRVGTAWTGRVVQTHYDSDDPGTGLPQTIQAERVSVHYGDNTDFADNNEPIGTLTGVPGSAAMPGNVTAYPWPARHDQRNDIVLQRDKDAEPLEPGKLVSVFAGMDGRYYYTTDELPFAGIVIANLGILDSLSDPPADPDDGDRYIVVNGENSWAGHDGEIATWDDDGTQWVFTDAEPNSEGYAGGIGEFGMLKVRRLILAADTDVPPVITDGLQTDDGFWVEYEFVKVIGPTSTHHGYRVGDNVFCFRRGLYIFALTVKEKFQGHIMAAGPNDEVDLEGNIYWVREVEAGITYETDTGVRTNVYEMTFSEPARGIDNDPSESGGEHVRWVLAVNTGEDYFDAVNDELAQTHYLTVGRNLVVDVTMVADGADGELDGPGYLFTMPPPANIPFQATEDWNNVAHNDSHVEMVRIHAFDRTGTAITLLGAPPGAPSDWDIHEIDTGATGLWSGHDDEYATWNDDAGVWMFQDAVEVILPRTGAGAASGQNRGDPNVRQWDVLGCAISANGEVIPTTDYMDMPIGSYIMRYDLSANYPIPPGWQLADGTNGTLDLRDKLLMGSTAANEGNTGIVDNNGDGTTEDWKKIAVIARVS